jgi:hypothetical protein
MKKSVLSFTKALGLVTLFTISIVSFNGCAKKKGCMTQADDKYDATAEEADATKCDPEGTVNKFIGSYNVVETCGTGNDNYTITITKSSTGDYKILISNFFNTFGSTVINADVSQSNVTIPSQTIMGITVNGNGSISGTTLSLSYTVSSSAGQTSCTATCAKQ